MTNALKDAVRDCARVARRGEYGAIVPTYLRHAGKSYVVSACTGEAHSAEAGGNVDNCYTCAPLWGIRVEPLGSHVESYLEWLEHNLVADLHASGSHATAEDFEHCMVLIRALMTHAMGAK